MVDAIEKKRIELSGVARKGFLVDELSFKNGLDFIWREGQGTHASEENNVSEAPVQSGWTQGPSWLE